MACNATLLKQWSRRTCTNEAGRATFGCSSDDHMWVGGGCRGWFLCADAEAGLSRRIQCWSGTSLGRHQINNCSCRQADLGSNETTYAQHPKPTREGTTARWCADPHWCPNTAECPPKEKTQRVFEIRGGAKDAAFGNLFYTTVSNAVLYARHKGFVPWVRFAPEWTAATMGRWNSSPVATNATPAAHQQLWELFFEPLCPNMSEWLAACANVVLAPAKPRSFYYPQIAQIYRWPIRSWCTLVILESRSLDT